MVVKIRKLLGFILKDSCNNFINKIIANPF